MLLQDRVAIVTGASMGAGAGIAQKFSDEGCSVAVVDIADAKGKKVAEDIKRKGGKAIFIHCDVTDWAQVQAMAQKTLDTFGKIDILVNNAGGVPGVTMEETIENISTELWDRLMDLNLKSQFFCCKAVVKHMKAQKYGKIVNLSSIGATFPPVCVAHYGAAKAGVLGLTVNLAVELAKYNITVNAILPGPIKTSFYDKLLGDKIDKDIYFSEIAKKNVPMQRIGMPEDIARAALFLASDLSGFVTGDSIYVGGGAPLPVIQ
jgi:3-oxoacyl-[acyl-carrier protein] reductase